MAMNIFRLPQSAGRSGAQLLRCISIFPAITALYPHPKLPPFPHIPVTPRPRALKGDFLQLISSGKPVRTIPFT